LRGVVSPSGAPFYFRIFFLGLTLLCPFFFFFFFPKLFISPPFLSFFVLTIRPLSQPLLYPCPRGVTPLEVPPCSPHSRTSVLLCVFFQRPRICAPNFFPLPLLLVPLPLLTIFSRNTTVRGAVLFPFDRRVLAEPPVPRFLRLPSDPL